MATFMAEAERIARHDGTEAERMAALLAAYDDESDRIVAFCTSHGPVPPATAATDMPTMADMRTVARWHAALTLAQLGVEQDRVRGLRESTAPYADDTPEGIALYSTLSCEPYVRLRTLVDLASAAFRASEYRPLEGGLAAHARAVLAIYQNPDLVPGLESQAAWAIIGSRYERAQTYIPVT
jgi:hypothetical protein